MCVIVIKKKSISISKSDLESMLLANPDGVGITYINHSGLVTEKLGKIQPNELFKKIEALKDFFAVLHFRLATHGKVVNDLCHPFAIDSDLENCRNAKGNQLLFHNGIISGFGESKDSEISDSLDFAQFLSTIDPVYYPKLFGAISSKFLVLTRVTDKKITYQTYGQFEEYKGLKVSNTYFNQKPAWYGNECNYFNYQNDFDSFKEYSYSKASWRKYK